MIESRQSYCHKHRVQFFWPTLYSLTFNLLSRSCGVVRLLRHAALCKADYRRKYGQLFQLVVREAYKRIQDKRHLQVSLFEYCWFLWRFPYINVKLTVENIYVSRVRIGGAGGRGNVRLCRMQQRIVLSSDVL